MGSPASAPCDDAACCCCYPINASPKRPWSMSDRASGVPSSKRRRVNENAGQFTDELLPICDSYASLFSFTCNTKHTDILAADYLRLTTGGLPLRLGPNTQYLSDNNVMYAILRACADLPGNICGRVRVVDSTVWNSGGSYFGSLDCPNDQPLFKKRSTSRRDFDIFNQYLVLLPICHDNHWSLCFLVNVCALRPHHDGGVGQFEIFHFDPWPKPIHNTGAAEKIIKIWLLFKYETEFLYVSPGNKKSVTEYLRSLKTTTFSQRTRVTPSHTKQRQLGRISQTTNFDCGVFVIEYARRILHAVATQLISSATLADRILSFLYSDSAWQSPLFNQGDVTTARKSELAHYDSQLHNAKASVSRCLSLGAHASAIASGIDNIKILARFQWDEPYVSNRHAKRN